MIPFGWSVQAVAHGIEALRLAVTRSFDRIARLPAPPAIPFRSVVRAAGAVLALAFTSYAVQQTDRPQPDARSAVPPGPGLAPTPLEPPQLPVLPAPSLGGEQPIARASTDRRSPTFSVSGLQGFIATRVCSRGGP
jgi:hypothetical protein